MTYRPDLPPRLKDRCELMQADYRETLARAAEMGGADLVLTSPPYCDARTYGMDCNWTMDDYRALGDAIFGALKPGGWCLLNVDAPVREWRPGMGTERGLQPFRLLLDWADRVGFRVPDRLAFVRRGMPGFYPERFANEWEPLWWFQRPGAAAHFDSRAIARKVKPYKTGSQRNSDGTSTSMARCGDLRLPSTVFDCGFVGSQSGAPEIEAQNHPARWPYKLARDIIKCFCPPDGLACDPFLGAGTSAAAAIDHGRRFIGGDLGSRQDNEDNQRRGLDPVPWVDVAARVLIERTRQVDLFSAAK